MGQGNMVALQINGDEQSIAQGTLAELIDMRQPDSSGLVVEYNGNIVRETDWKKIRLHDGDVIEMLCFVGGG